MAVDEPTDKLRKKKPCPSCNSEWIDANVKILQMYDSGNDKMEAWCFCRHCGCRSISAIARFGSREEALDAAFVLWNNS